MGNKKTEHSSEQPNWLESLVSSRDVILCKELLENANLDGRSLPERHVGMLRRSYVRAVYANIEQVTQILKLLALERHDYVSKNIRSASAFSALTTGGLIDTRDLVLRATGGRTLENAEIAVLLEDEVSLSDKGKLGGRKRKMRLRTLPNFRFAFQMYAEVHGLDYHLVVDGPGWEHMKNGIRIRDRLTHPGSEKLDITDSDFEAVANALEYVHSQVTTLIQSTPASSEINWEFG